MKKIKLFIALCFLSLNVFSQFTNLNWKLGANLSLDFITGQGVVNLNDSNQSTMNFTNTSITDRNGKIIFYSNACKVYNRNGDTMSNGSGFNHGFYSDQYVNTDYYPLVKAATIIPFPNDTNKFYLLYLNMDWNVDGAYMPGKLYYLVVDKTLNGGLGDVVIKDQVVINNDTLGNNISSVKHGNGKDWWIIVRKHKGNTYYKVLIDSNGVHSPTKQIVGNNFSYSFASEGGGISMQGDKLCYLYESLNYQPFQLDLLNFDRCSGQLSNYQTIFHPNTTDTINWWAACFSASGRYLYLNDKYKVYQMDLQASNLLNSIQVVGNNTAMGALFFKMELAPDGKIYVAPYGSYEFMSVIHAPDSAGIACRFVENAVHLGSAIAGPWANGGLPNTPNFALGAINCNVGIENVGNENNGLNIYPNPTNSTLKISSRQNIKLITVFDMVGKEIFSEFINKKTENIDLEGFSNGLYFIKAVNENGEVKTKKIVKE